MLIHDLEKTIAKEFTDRNLAKHAKMSEQTIKSWRLWRRKIWQKAKQKLETAKKKARQEVEKKHPWTLLTIGKLLD